MTQQLFTANPPSSIVPATGVDRLVRALEEIGNQETLLYCTCNREGNHRAANTLCVVTIATDALNLYHAEQAVLANIPAPIESDNTAGHSTGNWKCDFDNAAYPMIETSDKEGFNYKKLARFPKNQIFNTWDEVLANFQLFALAQSAPHNCGDPNCPGVINQRKLQLYDKFQLLITEFQKQGILT